MSKLAVKALKAAKGCIDEKDFKGAQSKAEEALSFDPQNFYGFVFLGLSLFNLKEYDESESAYRHAVEAEQEERQRKERKERPEAWQGLLNLYEEQKKIDQYIDAAVRVAGIWKDQDDRPRCQAAVNKIVPFVQEHGTKNQLKQALNILLPTSSLYDFLEGLIPRPDQTYLKLAEMIETEEKEYINKEIGNRRSRLGAVYGRVKTEVEREVWGASPLEDIYQHILNWSDDEELRRSIDCKLLKHGYDKLLVFQKENKLAQRLKVENWARGLVILKHPFELAYKIVIEWKDCENIGDHDVGILRDYIEFFPNTGLAISLNAYLNSELSPFPPPPKPETEEPTVEESDNTDGVNDEQTQQADTVVPDDNLDAMIEGIEKSPRSVLCHRILVEYYLSANEFESAVELSRAAQKLVSAESQRTGLSLQRNYDSVAVSLATALINYQSPKHHMEARGLFETVLKHNTTHGNALVGLGLILEEQDDYSGASDLLQQALERDPENLKIKSEAAWCTILQGDYEKGKAVLEECLEACAGIDPRSRDMKAQILWRIGTAMWNNNEPSRSDRKGPYSYFISAVQQSQNFAPAYTSLGIFYADIQNDHVRANKCFQRAFEISAGEVEAAERLARSFAESKEWELVEIVARRVAEADKKRSVPGKGVSWPQSAIGVVELNNQNYPQAIVSFQSALRSSPNDFHAWLGLGEAYASSGRYTAALKVFTRAEALEPSNWFAKYMLANVRRDLGEFELACEGYRAVLELRKDEFGVLIALSETLLGMAWHYVESGFYGRAIKSAIECLNIAESIRRERSDAFNLWKTVGDACMLFSWVHDLADQLPREKVLSLIGADVDVNEFDILAEVDRVGQTVFDDLKKGDLDGVTSAVYLGILAYKRAVYASAEDRHAHAVAWFNLGTAEYRAYVSLPAREMKHRLTAIRCFKRTIKLEPGNHEFWNALGVTTAELNPKVAQHALVRSLYINDKNARVWTNLAALYALQEDYMLANETFSRAQSTDPEYALAWVGQGVLATILGDDTEAQELFQHAFDISDHALTPVKRLFTASTFDTLVKSQNEPSLVSVLTPIFALQKLEAQLSNTPTILHLSALFDERVADFGNAESKLTRVCDIYEEQYEKTESDEDLLRFAQSKADLARMQLGLQSYQAAIENASLALDLSGDLPSLESCRLSAHLTAGLAHYYTRNMDESLEMFKAALTESSENPDVVCLLSQVLWAKGGEQEREVAREQLFACIESHPTHIPSMLLLGAIGVLDSSPEVAEAVVDGLRAVRADHKLSTNTQEEIENVLTSIAQLSSDDTGNSEAVSAATSAVFVRPAMHGNWRRLATVAEDAFAAETALKVAMQEKERDCEKLAKAYAGIAKVECDLKAIFVAPWMSEGWNALKADVSVQA